jgi:hypothetical protein
MGKFTWSDLKFFKNSNSLEILLSEESKLSENSKNELGSGPIKGIPSAVFL